MSAATPQQDNPLAAGLERLPVHPTALTIFGATGDLAQRKLLPALYNLAHEGALPERFNLIGTSRSEHSDDEFREWPPRRSAGSRAGPRTQAVLTRLLDDVRYVAGSFDDPEVYASLGSGPRRVRHRGGRRSAEPLLLPVDRADVLPRHHRGARRGGPDRA